MASGSGPAITSYQHYGSTPEGGEFASVAFQPPSITTQPYPSMGGPQQHRGYQRLEEYNDVEDDFDVGCLNSLNRYLLVKCIPPKRKAKHYSFITKLNCILSLFLCACCCALPCIYFAKRQAKQVKVLNNQRDYLSAKSRSYVVVTCNIVGFVCIFIADILIVTIFALFCVLLSKLP